jgi:hypothetical protein
LPVSEERIGIPPNLARIAAGVFVMGSADASRTSVRFIMST